MSDPVAIALIGILSSAILGASAMLAASLSRRVLADMQAAIGENGGRTLHEAIDAVRSELVRHVAADDRAFAAIHERLDHLAR